MAQRVGDYFSTSKQIIRNNKYLYEIKQSGIATQPVGFHQLYAIYSSPTFHLSLSTKACCMAYLDLISNSWIHYRLQRAKGIVIHPSEKFPCLRPLQHTCQRVECVGGILFFLLLLVNILESERHRYEDPRFFVSTEF